jgi:hypothetical protein
MRNSSEGPDSAQILQWECGWDEHQTMQLQRMAKLSLPEKIAWLEEAQRLILHLKAANASCRKTGDRQLFP